MTVAPLLISTIREIPEGKIITLPFIVEIQIFDSPGKNGRQRGEW
jgi:hypothetical protein